MAKQCMIIKKNENKLHEHDVKFKNIRWYIAPPPYSESEKRNKRNNLSTV